MSYQNHGLGVEILNIGYAVRLGERGRVIGVRRVEGPEFIDPVNEYFLPLSEGPPPSPAPDDAAVLAAATQQLKALQAVATAQVNAIRERLEVLTFAQESGDQTEEEAEEFSAATTGLSVWQTYRVELGRVKTVAGWPVSPTWPTPPAALYPSPVS